MMTRFMFISWRFHLEAVSLIASTDVPFRYYPIGPITIIPTDIGIACKRKQEVNISSPHGADTSKPTAVFEPAEGRAYTLSIALPGSIVANAQSPELKIALAGQIARALAVFCVDEVVIFDDGHVTRPNSHGYIEQFDKNSYTGYSNPNFFLMHILSYLETPPHLRRHLFPMHPDLKLAGALPSLDMPHHLRAHEWCRYREGITIEMSQPSSGGGEVAGEQAVKHKNKKQKTAVHAPSAKSLVESGLPQKVSIEDPISPGTRVTLKFSADMVPSKTDDKELLAVAVAPSTPREEAGYYWGYSVRSAPSVSAVLTECPHDGGYDLTFGTSERGFPISTLIRPGLGNSPVPSFTHMLICFGGVAGLEVAVKADEELAGMGISEPKDLFDYWVDLCPGQGSRTIRTEEAVWLGLMGLREIVVTKGQK